MSLLCAQETFCCSPVTWACTVLWYDLCLLWLADLGRNQALEKDAALGQLPWVSVVWLSQQKQCKVSDRWGRGVLDWRNKCSPPCLGNRGAHSDFLCHSLCAVFFPPDSICCSAEHTECLKHCKLAVCFGKLSPECLHFDPRNYWETSTNFELSLLLWGSIIPSPMHAMKKWASIFWSSLTRRVRPQRNSVMIQFSGLLVEDRPAGHAPLYGEQTAELNNHGYS